MASILLGTALGQGVLLLASPVLTRLYTTDDFGVLAVCTSLLAIISAVSTLRLEAAVPLPRDDVEAAAVARAGIFSAVCISIVVVLVGLAFDREISQVFGAPILGAVWWIMGLATFALGLNQVLSAWMTRERRYNSIGVRNFAVGMGQLITQAGLGVAGIRPLGLVFGLAAGYIAGSGGLLSRGGLLRQERSTRRQVWAAVVRYKKFPLLSTWSGLLNSLGLQAPLLVLSAHYGLVTVGLVGITIRVLSVPVATVGQAVASLYRGQVGAQIREDSRNLSRYLRSVTLRMLAIGLLPTIVLAFFGRPLFGFAFGPQWSDAGNFAFILSFGYLAQLAVSPVSQTLLLLERQHHQLAWDLARLAVTAGGLFVSISTGHSIGTSLVVLSMTQVVSYIALYALCATAARNYDAGTQQESMADRSHVSS